MGTEVPFTKSLQSAAKFIFVGVTLATTLAHVKADDTISAQAGLASAKSLSAAFRSAAEKALPAVVTILGREENKEQPVLNYVGGRDEEVYSSVGSGVIISHDGLILTNHHVVAGMQVIDVRTYDGRQFRAEDIKSDPESDLAILRIKSSAELPLAELGDSDQMHVGDWVLAIGSPFTLESSVSAGIISRAQRHRKLSASVIGIFLQTDAAINPGNSGGPLLDLDGKVIGINTAISSQSGGFQGVGFAIPVARAKWIRKELEEFGKVRRALAGITVEPVPPGLAEKQKLAHLSGAYVTSTRANKPGQKAGLQPGDIITSLGGQPVSSSSSFFEIVQRSPIDQPLKIEIIREEKKMELEIKLEPKE